MEATQTLSAIDADSLVEAESRQGHRNHLGASIIGRNCSRELWYTFRWFGREEVGPRILRLFRRGDREEFEFIHRLERIGIVREVNPTGKQWRMIGQHGHFGGSLDDIVLNVPDLPPGTRALAEYKTHNEKQFKKLRKDGLCNAKFEHFAQMQTYMEAYNLDFGLYCAVCKNDDNLYLEVVRRDGMTGPRMDHKAGQVIWSQEPPPRIANSPGDWRCMFCSFKKTCYQPDRFAPEVNCRSCSRARPTVNGDWACDWHQRTLKDFTACDGYERIA